ncbi:MAG: response regulator transcription factor [Chitinophagaceae bacterium]
MPNHLHILIASDHKALRESLTRTLNSQPYFHVVAVCADTYAALTMVQNTNPDIVIIDGSTDTLTAIEATKKIVACSAANVIGISRTADETFAQHMIAAGALGFLTSQSTDRDLVCAVETVAKDNLYNGQHIIDEPIATPTRFSSLKKSITALANGNRNKNNDAAPSHWHAILQFAN